MRQGKEGLNRHYSAQGGHKARGQAARLKAEFEQSFPNTPFVSAGHIPSDQIYRLRRQMFRGPRDGR